MLDFIPKNVGRLDQIIRLFISSSMIYAGFVNEELIQDDFSSNLLAVIGLVLLYTVIMRNCPMYSLIGWSSCRNQQSKCNEKSKYE